MQLYVARQIASPKIGIQLIICVMSGRKSQDLNAIMWHVRLQFLGFECNYMCHVRLQFTRLECNCMCHVRSLFPRLEYDLVYVMPGTKFKNSNVIPCKLRQVTSRKLQMRFNVYHDRLQAARMECDPIYAMSVYQNRNLNTFLCV